MTRVVFEEVLCQTALNRVACGLPFRWTLNPYRGCQHACVYCFARSTHTYLGYNVGRDFERRIVVKINLSQVLRQELRRDTWRRELIALGTACDPYEPAEKRYRLTRGVLEVLLEFANPVSITTKGVLIVRDLDLLTQLAQVTTVRANFSIGTLDEEVGKRIEPGAPGPIRRLEAMERLARAGVPAGVLLAPVIPGLTDAPEQLEAVVKAAVEHGAQYLSPNVLHLRPGSREWFMPFLREAYPHLMLRYRQMYRGSYAPKEYTQRVLELVEDLRARWGLFPREQAPPPARGQLALVI